MCVRVVSSLGANLVFEVRPRRACGACGVYGLGSPRVVGVAAPSDPVGSSLVEILQVRRRGRRARVLEPRNKSPVFAIALSLSPLLVISCMLLLVLSLHA